MDYYLTISSKGQVTIPKEVRKILGIDLRDKIRLRINKKQTMANLIPTKDLLDMAGFLSDKPHKNKDVAVEKAREIMHKNYERA